MRVAFFGAEGKVGSAIVPRLEAAGHEVRGIELGDEPDVAGCDAAVDFTTPEAVPSNVRAALEQGVSCIVGTTGWEPGELGALAAEKTETIKVSGWHCGGCAARTEAALKEVKGVSAVASDKTKHLVKVTYDDAKVKRQDLDKAIADSGFSAEE